MATQQQQLLAAHQPRWQSTWEWLSFFAAFLVAEGLLLWTFREGVIWLVVPLIVLIAHLMHAHLIALHEAAHGALCPHRWGNEIIGMIIGTLSFLGFSLYRAAHHTHHAFLSTERDEELWPFVIPGTPRWLRRLAAVAELTLGLVYTPFMFLRTFFRRGSPIREKAVRRRIWAEFALMAVGWGSIVAVIAWREAWMPLLVLYVIPAFLAANMQSLRKYIEHMGMTGRTVLGCTRSIIAKGPLGRLLSFSLFHIFFHGIHHLYARMPHASLPDFTSSLSPLEPDDPSPFCSYSQALWDMLRSLKDPRVGPQWRWAETGAAGVRIGRMAKPILQRAMPSKAAIEMQLAQEFTRRCRFPT